MKQLYLQSNMHIWQKQKWINEWRNGGTSERMNEKAKKKWMNKFSKGLDIHLCSKLTRIMLNKTKNNKLLINYILNTGSVIWGF